MNDRELLELAAKAAGIELDFTIRGDFPPYYVNERGGHSSWNPLADDGEALRLSVNLEIDVSHYQDAHVVDAFHAEAGTCSVDYNGDRYAATRRAIVLVAAEIGKAMQ